MGNKRRLPQVEAGDYIDVYGLGTYLVISITDARYPKPDQTFSGESFTTVRLLVCNVIDDSWRDMFDIVELYLSAIEDNTMEGVYTIRKGIS